MFSQIWHEIVYFYKNVRLCEECYELYLESYKCCDFIHQQFGKKPAKCYAIYWW